MKMTVPNPESHDTGNSQRRDEWPGATAGFASFYNVFEGFQETVCGQGNRLRWTRLTVEMVPEQTRKPSFFQ